MTMAAAPRTAPASVAGHHDPAAGSTVPNASGPNTAAHALALGQQQDGGLGREGSRQGPHGPVEGDGAQGSVQAARGVADTLAEPWP